MAERLNSAFARFVPSKCVAPISSATLPNNPMQGTASQRACTRCFAAADRERWASGAAAIAGVSSFDLALVEHRDVEPS